MKSSHEPSKAFWISSLVLYRSAWIADVLILWPTRLDVYFFALLEPLKPFLSLLRPAGTSESSNKLTELNPFRSFSKVPFIFTLRRQWKRHNCWCSFSWQVEDIIAAKNGWIQTKKKLNGWIFFCFAKSKIIFVQFSA